MTNIRTLIIRFTTTFSTPLSTRISSRNVAKIRLDQSSLDWWFLLIARYVCVTFRMKHTKPFHPVLFTPLLPRSSRTWLKGEQAGKQFSGLRSWSIPQRRRSSRGRWWLHPCFRAQKFSQKHADVGRDEVRTIKTPKDDCSEAVTRLHKQKIFQLEKNHIIWPCCPTAVCTVNQPPINFGIYSCSLCLPSFKQSPSKCLTTSNGYFSA